MQSTDTRLAFKTAEDLDLSSLPRGPRSARRDTMSKFTQFSTIVLDDKSKHPEARKAWMDLASALGKETWGGVSTGDGPTVGLGLIAWESLEEAGAAYKDPKAAAAFAEYQSIGKVKNTMVQME
ncbi:hypothetical protein NM208_g5146 [Fusarium decemcellulare]|uniref:Uncharacterized protein n=1 Tax=Fusarium decemcellulare TaxID=57161 RepID=A0ACC1SII9_9HYPO|nr:hypothetical protein NM208_g5146 [Fusarium decemcellulare]